MWSRIIAFASILFMFSGPGFASTVQWKLSDDKTTLGEKLKGTPGQDVKRWVQGVWQEQYRGAAKPPCYTAFDWYYEFLPDGKLKHWVVSKFICPEHKDETGKMVPATDREVFKSSEKSGTYKILDDRTVELSADWEIGQ